MYRYQIPTVNVNAVHPKHELNSNSNSEKGERDLEMEEAGGQEGREIRRISCAVYADLLLGVRVNLAYCRCVRGRSKGERWSLRARGTAAL